MTLQAALTEIQFDRIMNLFEAIWKGILVAAPVLAAITSSYLVVRQQANKRSLEKKIDANTDLTTAARNETVVTRAEVKVALDTANGFKETIAAVVGNINENADATKHVIVDNPDPIEVIQVAREKP